MKLKHFLEKIRDVLADEKVHAFLVILILFGIRIFLLRLRKETLDRHFKFLWRWIVFLLHKIFKTEQWEDKDHNKKVKIAALKLLELMGSMDIDEFNLHKWAFLYENFCVEIRE